MTGEGRRVKEEERRGGRHAAGDCGLMVDAARCSSGGCCLQHAGGSGCSPFARATRGRRRGERGGRLPLFAAAGRTQEFSPATAADSSPVMAADAVRHGCCCLSPGCLPCRKRWRRGREKGAAAWRGRGGEERERETEERLEAGSSGGFHRKWRGERGEAAERGREKRIRIILGIRFF